MAAYIGQPTRSQRFIKAYLATWALLAAGALAYLAVLAFQPHQAATPRPQVADPDPGQAIRAMAKATVEMGTMRRNLSDVQNDVFVLKDAAVQREAKDKTVSSRLTAVEERLAAMDAPPPTAEAITPKAKIVEKAPRKTPDARAAARVIVVPQGEAAQPPPAKVDGPPAPLETGSIAPTEEITFGEPIVTPAASTIFAIQLAAGPSLQGLRQSWEQLRERHGGALAALQPRVVPPRAEGGPYRLLAGPFATKADADRICADMGVGRNGCFATAYVGAPL